MQFTLPTCLLAPRHIWHNQQGENLVKLVLRIYSCQCRRLSFLPQCQKSKGYFPICNCLLLSPPHILNKKMNSYPKPTTSRRLCRIKWIPCHCQYRMLLYIPLKIPLNIRLPLLCVCFFLSLSKLPYPTLLVLPREGPIPAIIGLVEEQKMGIYTLGPYD